LTESYLCHACSSHEILRMETARTGILRLSVLQMLIGSTPFLLLNTPTVMGGAFQLRRAESDMWYHHHRFISAN
jgi:hypothetical protein